MSSKRLYSIISGGARHNHMARWIIRDCVADGDTSAGLRKGHLSHQSLEDFHAGALKSLLYPKRDFSHSSQP
jgi:hypothetical protein